MLLAKDETGKTVIASEALSANTGNSFHCIKCKERVVLKNGNIRQRHFAHCSGKSCELAVTSRGSYGESQQHFLAKELFKTFVERKHKIIIRKQCCNCFSEKEDLIDVDDVNVSIEHKIENSIVDISLKYNDGREIAIEVLFSHKTNIRPVPIWYEINACDILDSSYNMEHYFKCQRNNRKCKSPNCKTMKDLAIDLGYLAWNPEHSWEEVAILWKNHSGKIDHDFLSTPISSLNNTEWNKLWTTFAKRKRCLICCSTIYAIYKKPYCSKCYYSRPVLQVDVTPELKTKICEKYSFLRDIPHIRNIDMETTEDDVVDSPIPNNEPLCLGSCGRVLNRLWSSTRPFFFYGHRQICYMCVERKVGLNQ
jgi:hypothetical protein